MEVDVLTLFVLSVFEHRAQLHNSTDRQLAPVIVRLSLRSNCIALYRCYCSEQYAKYLNQLFKYFLLISMKNDAKLTGSQATIGIPLQIVLSV